MLIDQVGLSNIFTLLFVEVRSPIFLKRIGCAALKEMIETDKLIIPDFDTIAELTTFASKYNSYEAEEGHHDDLAMGLVVFAWLVQQQYFKDMTDLDIRQQMYKDQMKSSSTSNFRAARGWSVD